jgi:ABC-type proline/glycine betaine transport system permease subunit
MTAIVLRTLLVSGLATLLAVLVGVPAGYVIARRNFRGRTLLLGLVNTGMGMPPVIVGLMVWVMLVRSGPFGDLGLISTQAAMVVAQFLLADRLSGGEGCRVSLARALCLRAPVVLLDEPLAGLDETAYARLIDEHATQFFELD